MRHIVRVRLFTTDYTIVTPPRMKKVYHLDGNTGANGAGRMVQLPPVKEFYFSAA